MCTLAQQFGFTQAQARLVAAAGFDLLEAGDLEGAAVIFEGLLAINPRDGSLHAALGAVREEQGRLAEAEAAYSRAIDLDGKAMLARINRGTLRLRRGHRAGKTDLLVAAAEPSPVQARALATLARTGG